MREYQICTNCVMDTSDTCISFNEEGVCDHCQDFNQNVKPNWHVNENSRQELRNKMDQIKKAGSKNDFDCILGISGGVDSSYLLHIAVKEFGLKPLVFHVDGGWNSELAVHNIQMLVDKLGLDLYTEVINWEEMKDFQLALFKSGIPYLDIAQDHAFVATLYKFADKYNIKYILNGGNISTECVRNPKKFYYYGTDMLFLKDIIKKFGTIKMNSYPFSSIFKHKIYLRYIRGIEVVKPLNFIPYIKENALHLLEREYNWKVYPQKHFESRFTKFFESYWLPERFGFDPRRIQYSSLILTNQMTREDALRKMEKSSYDIDTIDDEFSYIATKLGIMTDQLNEYFNMEKKYYWDYNNISSIFDVGAKVLKAIGIEKTIKR